MVWWIFALVLLIVIAWIAFRPISINSLVSHPQPITTYEEAVAYVNAMQEHDKQDLTHDVCVTKLYTHGAQREHVIVLLHGFTTCPQQFDELGKRYYEAGHNVFIPRIPHHGLSDRLTNALVDLTAEDFAAFGDNVTDIAHGLGKKVTLMGLSGSGTLVAWLAQNREDIDFAFPIAPLLGRSEEHTSELQS